MNIPTNRVVAFIGPVIAAIGAAVAAWLVSVVNVLGIPGLDQANVQTYVTAGITALVIAGLHLLGGLAWFKGHHIILSQSGAQDETDVLDPQLIGVTPATVVADENAQGELVPKVAPAPRARKAKS